MGRAPTSTSQQPQKPQTPTSSESGSVFDVYLKRMHDVYEKHAPSKKASVKGFLERSSGEEHDLYLKVCKKYGVSPKAKYTPDSTKGSSASSTANSEFTTSSKDFQTEEGLIGMMSKIAMLPPAQRT